MLLTVYAIKLSIQTKWVKNQAIEVWGKDNDLVTQERQKLSRDKAYGNIAELGFGVLKKFGIKPIGEVLLDEKLGFHIAFGRSDHFGGIIGPKDFSTPQNVVHIDRIYIPETQPKVHVTHVTLVDNNHTKLLMKNGDYVIF